MSEYVKFLIFAATNTPNIFIVALTGDYVYRLGVMQLLYDYLSPDTIAKPNPSTGIITFTNGAKIKLASDLASIRGTKPDIVITREKNNPHYMFFPHTCFFHIIDS